jgi:hypothetical protein
MELKMVRSMTCGRGEVGDVEIGWFEVQF